MFLIYKTVYIDTVPDTGNWNKYMRNYVIFFDNTVSLGKFRTN